MKTVWACMVIVAFGCSSKPSPSAPEPLTTYEVITKTRAALDSVKSYTVTLVQTTSLSALAPEDVAEDMAEMKTATTNVMSTLLPDKMKLELSMDSGDEKGLEPSGMEMTALFDGENLWSIVEPPKSMAEAKTQIVKISKRVQGSDRGPFDFGYYITGGGLSAGKDLIATLQELIARYSFASSPEPDRVDGHPCLRLHGTMTAAQAVERLFSSEPNRIAQLIVAKRSAASNMPAPAASEFDNMVVSMLKSDLSFDIWISEQDFLPRKWALGSDKADDVVVVFTKSDFDAKLSAEQFKLEPEIAKQAIDVTDRVAESRKSIDQILSDTEAVAAFREELLQTLAEPTAE
ncbi:MAG: hypothetical protein AAF735_06370 [Myxococcota bacterium]